MSVTRLRGGLKPARRRPNLTIRTHAHAARVVTDGNRAVGVEYLDRNSAKVIVTAEREDTRCTVSRFSLKERAPERHQCSLRLSDVLKTMADMGGTYADAVDFLRQAKRDECLSCPLWEDALPQAPSPSNSSSSSSSSDRCPGS